MMNLNIHFIDFCQFPNDFNNQFNYTYSRINNRMILDVQFLTLLIRDGEMIDDTKITQREIERAPKGWMARPNS